MHALQASHIFSVLISSQPYIVLGWRYTLLQKVSCDFETLKDPKITSIQADKTAKAIRIAGIYTINERVSQKSLLVRLSPNKTISQ